jgi:hypothetical protein
MVGTPARPSNPVNSRPKLPLRNAVEYSQLFDFHDVFSGCLELAEAFGRPLDVDLTNIADCIRALIAKNFFCCVRRTVQKKSYHSMERMLNSGSCHQNADGKWDTPKLFRGYHRGDHVPRPKKVSQVEKLTRTRFRPEVNQVLWTALDVTVPLEKPLYRLFRRLPPRISLLGRQCSKDMTLLMRGAKIPDQAIYTSCSQLMFQASLPALAALTLLLRKAHRNHQQDVASTLALFIFRMLLVLGEELQQRGIAHLLYEFYLKNIFPLYSKKVLYESAPGMAQASQLLNLIAFTTSRRTGVTKLTFDQRLWEMHYILIGGHGYAFSQAFSPAFGPNSITATPDELARFRHQIDVAQRAWTTILKLVERAAVPLVFDPEFIDLDLDFDIFLKKSPYSE